MYKIVRERKTAVFAHHAGLESINQFESLFKCLVLLLVCSPNVSCVQMAMAVNMALMALSKVSTVLFCSVLFFVKTSSSFSFSCFFRYFESRISTHSSYPLIFLRVLSSTHLTAFSEQAGIFCTEPFRVPLAGSRRMPRLCTYDHQYLRICCSFYRQGDALLVRQDRYSHD